MSVIHVETTPYYYITLQTHTTAIFYSVTNISSDNTLVRQVTTTPQYYQLYQ